MRLARLVLAILLAIVLPVHGFAAATMRIGVAPAQPAQSVQQHAAHSEAPAATPARGTDAKAVHGAAAGRTMACCQPALPARHALGLASVAGPAQPSFDARPVSSWSAPVPRMPPRA